jgi:non-canonical (house-cleaning) NTP pyrophosphatase
MKVYVSSESSVKHAAVEAAFARLSEANAETFAVPMPSGVNEQPKSMDETYEGALNRHEQLVEKLGKKPDCYLITIESGIFTPRTEHNYFGTTVLVVEKNGERHVGIDVDLEFPRHMTDRVPGEFKDLGELVKKEYGAAVSDPFPYFTNGKITRQSVLENALYNVLVQFRDELLSPVASEQKLEEA